MTVSRPAPTAGSALGRTTDLEPFGLLLEGEGGSIADLPLRELAALTDRARVLVVRGYDLLDTADLESYCGGLGDILQWDFGAVLDLVVQQDAKNYLFTPGEVPFHWDGAFAGATPRYFIFQCLRSNEGGGGETVFCDTTQVYAEASEPERALWGALRVEYRTEKLAHYGGHVTHDLVSTHPTDGVPVLRYAEPLEAEHFLNPLSVAFHGADGVDESALVEQLRERLHDERYCYHHDWREGDFLIADNHALVHGRNAYKGDTSRHLQRIQVI